MSVLILSSSTDLHAQRVTEHLSSMEVPFTYWAVGDVLKEYRLQLSLSPSGYECALTPLNGATSGIDLTDVTAVWLRRPRPVQSHTMPEPWMESAVAWETARALDSIFRMLPALWVNDPVAHQQAGYKIRQLELARQCGLAVPETLVTNEPQAVVDFHEQMGGQLIYKYIDERTGQHFPQYEIPRGMPTMQFRESDLPHLEQVQYCLHLFQRKIEKRSDLRVTIIGEKLFPVEIHSQEGKGKLDFRIDYSVPMNKYQLPDPVAEGCLQLMKKMGLTFGAIDLCLGQDGQYYFFEVNPAGQWLWMEVELDLPISLELARLLCGQN